MDDKDIPNRASNMAKAEGDRVEDAEEVESAEERDRWSSDPTTIERRDRDRPESGADVNRSQSETPVPPRDKPDA
jgi:hypothetical protein